MGGIHWDEYLYRTNILLVILYNKNSIAEILMLFITALFVGYIFLNQGIPVFEK